MPADAIRAIEADGHDIDWIGFAAHGSSDEAILQRAQLEGRVLLTFDKDFGELAFRAKLPAASGIILFRVIERNAPQLTAFIVAALRSRADWAGLFSVVEKDRIRMTRLP